MRKWYAVQYNNNNKKSHDNNNRNYLMEWNSSVNLFNMYMKFFSQRNSCFPSVQKVSLFLCPCLMLISYLFQSWIPIQERWDASTNLMQWCRKCEDIKTNCQRFSVISYSKRRSYKRSECLISGNGTEMKPSAEQRKRFPKTNVNNLNWKCKLDFSYVWKSIISGVQFSFLGSILNSSHAWLSSRLRAVWFNFARDQIHLLWNITNFLPINCRNSDE